MNNPIISARDIHKSFQKGGREIKVLEGLNLDINKKDLLAIVGASGVGKSTLLHILGTLDFPTKGSISYEGKEIIGAIDKFRNKTIGFVFQFHYLMQEFSALENTIIPALVGGMSKKESLGLAEDILEKVGLKDRLNHKPGELSGGEQQRVAIARALVLKPKILLADEPTGNLDPKTGEKVFSVLLELREKQDVTIVVATHNEKLASKSDRILRLENGKIFEN